MTTRQRKASQVSGWEHLLAEIDGRERKTAKQRGEVILALDSAAHNTDYMLIVSVIERFLEDDLWLKPYILPGMPKTELVWLPGEFDYFLAARNLDPKAIKRHAQMLNRGDLVVTMADAMHVPHATVVGHDETGKQLYAKNDLSWSKPGWRRSLDEVCEAHPLEEAMIRQWFKRYTGSRGVNVMGSMVGKARENALNGKGAHSHRRAFRVAWTDEQDPAWNIASGLQKRGLAGQVMELLQSGETLLNDQEAASLAAAERRAEKKKADAKKAKERAARDKKIIAARRKGHPWAQIAADFHVDKRTARVVCSDYPELLAPLG